MLPIVHVLLDILTIITSYVPAFKWLQTDHCAATSQLKEILRVWPEQMQDTQAAQAQQAEDANARSNAVTELQAAQVRIATLEDCAAAADAMSRTEALQTQGLREHVQSLQLQLDGLQERCTSLQDSVQRVSVLTLCHPTACMGC
jgi:chromosome segregation ATPase